APPRSRCSRIGCLASRSTASRTPATSCSRRSRTRWWTPSAARTPPRPCHARRTGAARDSRPLLRRLRRRGGEQPRALRERRDPPHGVGRRLAGGGAAPGRRDGGRPDGGEVGPLPRRGAPPSFAVRRPARALAPGRADAADPRTPHRDQRVHRAAAVLPRLDRGARSGRVVPDVSRPGPGGPAPALRRPRRASPGHRALDADWRPVMAPNPSSLRGRVAVVTGGSAGIGRALADRLAAAGASVIVGSRRPALGRFEHRTLDLASQASVAAFADGLVREGRPIDLLVLNAGVHVPWKKVTTDDGLELHWQVNHLSNFHLGHRLLDLCRHSVLKRVVYVASEAHRLAALPAAPLLGFWYRYAKSKEAAVASFLRLAELHPELTVRIVSPGY